MQWKFCVVIYVYCVCAPIGSARLIKVKKSRDFIPDNGDSDDIGIPLVDEDEESKGPGEPLFLTPYIESGQIEEGQKAAKSRSLVLGVKSYSGYLTVNKEFNSNMFFWYFVSEKDPENAPVVVWLQGGPGGSSLFGLFNENGPYIITKKHIKKRKYSWHKTTNLIYFENPVGTGYSFTERGYAKNQTVVGRDLYTAAFQFLQLFPHLQKNEFYITGESYAGKYVPAFGHTIHHRNEHAEFKINLKGLFIGDGFTDPVNMLVYGDYLFQLGLIDSNARAEFHKYESLAKKKIKEKKWREASKLFDFLVNDDTQTSLYFNHTGLVGHYNFVNLHSGNWYDYEDAFLNSNRFRRSVHVGNLTYNDGVAVYDNLYEDVSKSVISWVVELLKHYDVIFYNGQLDIICAYPLTVNFLSKMEWDGKEEYKQAKRQIWRIGEDVAGYYKSAKRMTEVLVRNSGHMVPFDEPKYAFYLLNQLIFNKTLTFSFTIANHH